MADNVTEHAIIPEISVGITDLKTSIQQKAMRIGIDTAGRPTRLTSYTTPQTIRVFKGEITDEETQRPDRVRKEIINLLDAGGLGMIYPDDSAHRWFSRKNRLLSPQITIDAVVREDEPVMGIRIGFAEGTYSTEAVLSVEGEEIFVHANKLGTEEEPIIIPKRPATTEEVYTFFKILTHPDLEKKN